MQNNQPIHREGKIAGYNLLALMCVILAYRSASSIYAFTQKRNNEWPDLNDSITIVVIATILALRLRTLIQRDAHRFFQNAPRAAGAIGQPRPRFH